MKPLNKNRNLNKKLLDLIVCPVTKESLTWNRQKNELISKKANLAYPIIDGIPVLIKEKARRL